MVSKLDKPFVVVDITRQSLIDMGIDAKGLTDKQMLEIADKVSEYLQQACAIMAACNLLGIPYLEI